MSEYNCLGCLLACTHPDVQLQQEVDHVDVVAQTRQVQRCGAAVAGHLGGAVGATALVWIGATWAKEEGRV